MERCLLQEIKAAIRSILISSKDKMTILQVEKDFKELMGYVLPYSKLGYSNTEHLLKSIPDIVKIYGCGPHAFVDCIPNEKTEHIRTLVQQQKSDTKRSKCYRNRNQNQKNHKFDNMNQQFQKQININNKWEGEEEEERKNNSKLNFHINSTDSCTGSSSNESYSKENRIINANKAMNSCLERVNNNYTKLQTINTKETTNSNCLKEDRIYFPLRIPRKQNQIVTNVEEEAVPAYAVPNNIAGIGKNHKKKNQLKCNIDTFQLNTNYPPQCELYETLKIGTIISLYICELIDPLKFYFHLNNEDHVLLTLENEMAKDYSKLAPNELCIVDSFIQPGRICAAKQDNNWYRAKILEVPDYLTDFNKVKLLFVDYGCVYPVSIKNLKYLMSKFMQIPMQTVCGRLANIKIVEPMRSATNYLQTLVQNRCLYAYITNINKKEPYMKLILTDTGVTPTLKINKHLIERGFAESVHN